MTRQPHDQFAKQYLEELLSPFGKVEVSRERILGKGGTQRQAITELLALPRNNPLRQNVQDLIASWRITIVNQENLTENDQELIMNLSPAYLEWREATRQEGRQEERRLVVENLLLVRFGSVDEELSKVIDALLQLPTEEFARVLLQLSSLSREELLALVWQ